MIEEDIQELKNRYLEKMDVSDKTKSDFVKCIFHHMYKEFLERSLLDHNFIDLAKYAKEKINDTDCPKKLKDEDICEDGRILDGYARSLANMYARRMKNGDL